MEPLRARDGIASCMVVAAGRRREARVLAESLRHRHPEIPCFALTLDGPDGEGEPWSPITLDELDIAERQFFYFRTTAEERRAACRVRLIRHLFDRGIRTVLSWSGRLQVVAALDEALQALVSAPVLLAGNRPGAGRAPAITSALWIGRGDAATLALLDWWRQAIDGGRSEAAVFDAMPSRLGRMAPLLSGIHRLGPRDGTAPAVERNAEGIRVDGEPALVLDFAALPDPAVATDVAIAAETCEPAARFLRLRYEEALRNASMPGEAERRDCHATFDDGVAIPAVARTLHRSLGDSARRFGDPFRVRESPSFFAWLNEPADEETDPELLVSRLWLATWQASPELRERFGDPVGGDRRAFLTWICGDACAEHGISERFVRRPFRRWRATGVRDRSLPFGVNLSGAMTSEKGIGEAARALLASLRGAGVPHVVNVHHDPGSRNVAGGSIAVGEENPYAVNLACLNASEAPRFFAERGADYFAGRANVAHWVWETEEFPRAWESSVGPFDEIWTPSSFVTEALRPLSPVPVHTIPYALQATLPEAPPPRFGVPRDVFVFLFVFDFASCDIRKNPLGLVRAFREAFAVQRDVLLMIKTSRPEFASEAWKEVEEIARQPNIRITNAVLDRGRTMALMATADCYVSLHRSEGFGLTLAEAMSLGKPVVATGYSGNMDFMTAENSLPVRYERVPVERPWGPYRGGYVWAEPDLAHAAERLRWVYENREAAAEIGRRGRADVLAELSPAAVGRRVVERLEALQSRAEAPSSTPATVASPLRGRHRLRFTGACDAAEFERRCGEQAHWYHSFYFDNGFAVRGDYDIGRDVDAYRFPVDLAGRTVLDVGTGSGWFATYFEQQGAEVTTVDLRGSSDWDWFGLAGPADLALEEPAPDRVLPGGEAVYYSPVSRGFWIMKELLGLRARYLNARVYDLRPELFGGTKFDLVFVGSLLMHLRDPVGALAAVRGVCGGTVIATSAQLRMPETGASLAMLVGGIAPDSWWIPNERCVVDWFRGAGFRAVEIDGEIPLHPDRPFVPANGPASAVEQTHWRVVAHA